MARDTDNTAQPQAKAPDFIAWHVTNRDNKAYWHKVGACWKHKDGKGMNLQLDVVPINGRIVLRHPADNAEKVGQA